MSARYTVRLALTGTVSDEVTVDFDEAEVLARYSAAKAALLGDVTPKRTRTRRAAEPSTAVLSSDEQRRDGDRAGIDQAE